MTIYGLSGRSGTGKSYRAAELCGRLGIEAIIDDGLFIYQNEVHGISAKKQPTKIGAVKCALFTDDAHRDSVAKSIEEAAPGSILILGTSDRMVRNIAERLGLPEPSEIIHIEEIATQDEMKKARDSRDGSGTHVIPAPTFQVRKQFSGYFLDPKRGFRSVLDRADVPHDKTIVRPTYSYLGSFSISDKVISDIAEHFAERTDGIAEALWVASATGDEGTYVRIIVRAEYGKNARSAALELQRRIAEGVAFMTAFNVLGVEVEIRDFKYADM
ncbi:MAG: hypothetical protein II488_03270 [Firmicutes bacterium]|nr:hypothetical protein [Bacillota bacterium]MBQ2058770.1 hypothetical protein [Bacillota bacterium]